MTHKKHYLALLLIWLLCCAFNITKAVHIDDTFYLETARWVLQSPLHPMSGQVNWVNTAEPIHRISASPLLIPYLLAALMGIFGNSQLAFHALTSLFTGLSIIAFYRVTLQLKIPHALLLTAAWGLSPAVVPSQNLMLDVPLIAVVLLFFSALLAISNPGSSSPVRSYLYAGLLAGIAPLIKYPGCILMPVLLFHLAIHKQWRHSWSLLIPIAMFGGWCAFNVYDYGAIHFLQSDSGTAHASGSAAAEIPRRFLDSLICLVAVFPLALLALVWLWREQRSLALIILALGGGAFLQSFVFQADSLTNALLRALFLGLSLSLLAGLGRSCWLYFANRRGADEIPSAQSIALLLCWITIGWGFVVVFAPVPAVRHDLIFIPALLLLTGAWIFPHFSKRAISLCVGASITIAMLLGLSDWQYSNLYRVQATQIRASLPPGATIYFVGHWGWQWYAAKAGMKQYDLENSVLQPGDYLVAPHMVGQIPISARYGNLLEPQKTIEVPGSPATWLRTMGGQPLGGFYGGGWNSLPWTFSTEPLEHFTIFKVSPVPVSNPPMS